MDKYIRKALDSIIQETGDSSCGYNMIPSLIVTRYLTFLVLLTPHSLKLSFFNSLSPLPLLTHSCFPWLFLNLYSFIIDTSNFDTWSLISPNVSLPVLCRIKSEWCLVLSVWIPIIEPVLKSEECRSLVTLSPKWLVTFSWCVNDPKLNEHFQVCVPVSKVVPPREADGVSNNE